MQVKKLALLGFGNAGQAFARLLLDKEDEIRRKYGCQVKVSAIATCLLYTSGSGRVSFLL